MKPIMLNGHERALTQIKYNYEGDLLFSVAKDSTPSVWYSHNGERLGTYDGHNGTVWSCDINYQSTLLLTGSADNSAKIWDVDTGKVHTTLVTGSAVRSVGWSYDSQKLLYTTDRTMGKQCELRLFSLSTIKQEGESANPYLTIPIPKQAPKISSALWGPLDDTIITGHDNGLICKWDATTGARLGTAKPHTKLITDMQFNAEMTMLVTSSKDTSAKLIDFDSLDLLKTYKTERPVNSAAISPIRDHIVLGGGQEAMEVTTTAGKQGKFDARFFHMVFEEELGRVKGHFGPINTLAFHPDGRSYSSGGEDGYVRIHAFDESYFRFEFEH